MHSALRQILHVAFAPVAALCLVCMTLGGCAKPVHDGRVLRISQRNEPGDLDPARASLPDEFFIIRALSEGLVKPVPTVRGDAQSAKRAPEVLPAVAERWDISDDHRVYTFHLRSDARWSNGDPVTAEDFLESYRQVLSPQTGAPKASLFFMVKNARAFATGELTDFSKVGFDASDRGTFVVTLERPMPQFLLYAASGPWIPTHPATVARHGRAWTRPENYVGNGAFTLAEWRPNQRIIVKKNSRYYGAASVKLDQIDFIAFDSGDTEDRAYRAGQIDVTMSVPPTKLDTHARERPNELHHLSLAETRYLTFNTQRAPLNDSRVRRALSLAIDRQRIVSGVLRGGHDAASQFLPPQLSRKLESSAAISQSLDEARRLLAEAGFPGGRSFPELELSTWPATPVVEAVQAMWQKELGITVHVLTREARVHIAALRDGHYDIGYMTAIPDVPDASALLGELVSGAPGNYPHWSDARFDELVSAAAASANLDEQKDLVARAETRLLAESPVAPLYFNARNWLMSPRVQGWQDDALWTRFYDDVEVLDR